MEYPLISVALCTYNGERYLEEQLETLVGQSYPNFEIVVVDDCSQDKTLEILDNFKDKATFRIFRNEHNLGYNRNFEKCLSYCEGDFIAFSDQDDLWDLQKLEKLQQNIGDSMIIYSDSYFIDEEGRSLEAKMSDIRYMLDDPKPLHLIMFNSISGHAMMMRKEMKEYIFPFPEKLTYDWWIALVAAAQSFRIKYLGEPLVSYRKHEDAATVIEQRLHRLRKDIARPRRYDASRVERFLEMEGCPYLSAKDKKVISDIREGYQSKLKKRFSLKLFYNLLRNANTIFASRLKSKLSNINHAFKESHTF